jgi:hypothetical protein
MSKLLRDRSLLPALDRLVAETMDAQLTLLAAVLARGGGRRREAAAALALEFATWQRLTGSGLDDGEAAGLMAELVVCAP